MDNKKTLFATIALSTLLLLTFLITQQALTRDNAIVLPEQIIEPGKDDEESSSDNFNTLSISPRTVQAAISTLSRPATYQRTQTVETFWHNGSSSSVYEVAVNGDTTRIDTTLVDSSSYHILMNTRTAAVWYDDETNWATLNAAEFTSDSQQRMPTYETVLDLSVSSIAQAMYCEKDGIWCIFVQTRRNIAGYSEKYWISAQSGLLYAAERLSNDTLIYRFTATEPQNEAPAASRFLLPDGSMLK